MTGAAAGPAMLALVEPLPQLVTKKFRVARANSDLLFSDTRLAVLPSTAGASFQLRYCPALAKKPKGDDAGEHKERPAPRRDPFANPTAELLVTGIPRLRPSHVLVLNKFPVIPNHFIIATNVDKPQTHVLEEDDIALTHACLQAWGEPHGLDRPSRLFAFFNSGEHSGASQPHRHLQFLPVDDMRGPEPERHQWDLLIDRMTTRAHPDLPLYYDPSLPFLHFSTPLTDQVSERDLHARYMLLMRAAWSASRWPEQALDDRVGVETHGSAPFSYNLAMTAERMAICPRTSEAVSIPGAGADGLVALNGTILAGTLMVKHEHEWHLLRESPWLLDSMLASIGFPPVSWDSSNERGRI